VGAPLNPALSDVRFCPRCGKEADVDYPRRLACPHCGYAAFFNPAPVVSVVLTDGNGRVWLARRGLEPGRGRWSTPGGYVDLGESVEAAAHRELKEELDLEIELLGLVGIYSKPEDRVILIVFAARALGTPATSPEALEVRCFAPEEIPWDELAFWNDEHALRDHLGTDGHGAARAASR
jgi:ADP-ribose pyrophosphatase YjhB (NUDIX family)